MPAERDDKSAEEKARDEKLRKLLSQANLASDNTSAMPQLDGKPDSEYLDNRPPHHG